MIAPRSMFDKVWESHLIHQTEQGDCLLYVDRCLIHEGARHAFDMLEKEGRAVARPDQIFAFADHYAPTKHGERGLDAVADGDIRGMIELLDSNTRKHGIRQFGLGNTRHGILHVVPPELGITQPGLLMVGADSHTSTHGALAALAFGVGASETGHVLATQTIWQRRPKTMRIRVDGRLPLGVTAKDVILAIIGRIGAAGAVGHAIEYAGTAIEGLSMEGRMTICNMSIEAGARCGMIAPDDTTFCYLEGREHAPDPSQWAAALAFWQSLCSDSDARFDRELRLDAAEIAPSVTWGTSPEHVLPIHARVPSPDDASSVEQRADYAAALEYTALIPGTPLEEIAVDQVFIGSCTNGRLEDLRAAAEVAKLGRAKVTTWVVPGSQSVKRAAEAEGLHHIFEAAGFEWRSPGCSLCTAINGDELAAGVRCASTSNRNFRGRQGRGSRTHLLSPAMAAAAAITGHLTDVRKLLC